MVDGVAAPALAVGPSRPGAGEHAVDVEAAVEVVDLVLQDAGVPAGGVELERLAVAIERPHVHGRGPGDDGAVAVDAEAALEPLGRRVVDDR